MNEMNDGLRNRMFLNNSWHFLIDIYQRGSNVSGCPAVSSVSSVCALNGIKYKSVALKKKIA